MIDQKVLEVGQYVIANVYNLEHGGHNARMCKVVDTPLGLRLSVYVRTRNEFKVRGLKPERTEILSLSSEDGFIAFKNGRPLRECAK